VPTQAQLDNFLQQTRVAAVDKLPTLVIEDKVLRYYRGQLYCSPKVIKGEVVIREVVGEGLSKKKVSLPLTVATRSGGEKIKIGNSNCHQSLKNCWQQWGVPPWLRGHYPLIFQDGKLIAVPGYAVDSEFAAAPDEIGLVVEFV